MLDHCQLACPPDSEALSRQFYGGVLGMTEIAKPAALAVRGGCWFAGYGTELHLGVEADFRPARKAHPAIRVNDLELVADRLRAAGQPVSIDDQEIPERRRFHCHDPHGNRLEFVADTPASWPLTQTHRVRRAVASDLAPLVALLADDPLGRDREDPDLAGYRRAFAAIDQDPAQLLTVVVDAQDSVVGTGQLTLTPGLSRGGTLRATLEAVRIAQSLRGQGVGSAFVRWAAGWAREQGAGLLQLTTDRSRTRAQDFYASLGFTSSHVGMKLPLT